MQLDIEPRSTPVVEGGTTNEPRGGYATPPPAASRFTFERVVRFLFITTVVVVVAWLLWYFLRLVIFLMVGIVLAYLMRPLMYRFQGMGLGHIPAIILTFVGFFGAVSIALTSLLPFLGAQISEVTQQISPDGIATAISQFASQWLPLEEVTIKDDITRLFNTLFQEDSLTQVMGSVVDIFTNLFYAILVIPFVTFFFPERRQPHSPYDPERSAQPPFRDYAGDPGKGRVEHRALFQGPGCAVHLHCYCRLDPALHHRPGICRSGGVVHRAGKLDSLFWSDYRLHGRDPGRDFADGRLFAAARRYHLPWA